MKTIPDRPPYNYLVHRYNLVYSSAFSIMLKLISFLLAAINVIHTKCMKRDYSNKNMSRDSRHLNN
jgi:hypothetical protein